MRQGAAERRCLTIAASRFGSSPTTHRSCSSPGRSFQSEQMGSVEELQRSMHMVSPAFWCTASCQPTNQIHIHKCQLPAGGPCTLSLTHMHTVSGVASRAGDAMITTCAHPCKTKATRCLSRGEDHSSFYLRAVLLPPGHRPQAWQVLQGGIGLQVMMTLIQLISSARLESVESHGLVPCHGSRRHFAFFSMWCIFPGRCTVNVTLVGG